jgi:hypothetical protein
MIKAKHQPSTYSWQIKSISENKTLHPGKPGYRGKQQQIRVFNGITIRIRQKCSIKISSYGKVIN